MCSPWSMHFFHEQHHWSAAGLQHCWHEHMALPVQPRHLIWTSIAEGRKTDRLFFYIIWRRYAFVPKIKKKKKKSENFRFDLVSDLQSKVTCLGQIYNLTAENLEPNWLLWRSSPALIWPLVLLFAGLRYSFSESGLFLFFTSSAECNIDWPSWFQLL